MITVRRLAIIVTIAALLSAIAYGAGWSTQPEGPDLAPVVAPPVQPAQPVPAQSVAPRPTSSPTPAPKPAPTPAPKPEREPALIPGPVLLGMEDQGAAVRDLQARLAQIDWFEGDVTGYYGEVTEAAVRGFQAKREIPVTGDVDRRTLDRLQAMTVEPSEAELTNQVDLGNVPGRLDPRCQQGRVLCIDKTTNTLRWVVESEVLKTVDVRFGGPATPTREGLFEVFVMSRDHVSSLYDTPMPFAMFFSGGQAVHYSPDFAAVGYAGASHGCVNVRDYDGVAWIFDQVRLGDDVVVYWS